MDDAEELFKIVVSTLPKNRFPSVIWDGTYFSDVRKMCIAAKNWSNANLADSPYRIRLNYPSLANKPRNIAQYWKLFDQWLDEETYGAAIIGITDPFDHWVVVHKSERTRIGFFDSDGTARYKNRSSLSFKKSTSPGRYRLDPQGTIIIRAIDTGAPR